MSYKTTHGSMGFMVNNHQTLKAGPKDKDGYYNHKSQTIYTLVIVISKHTW